MALWILAPDQAGNCCACGSRTGPCDSCSVCNPISIDPNNVNAFNYGVLQTVVPTGVFYTSDPGGILSSISLTNNNSRLTTSASISNIIVASEPAPPRTNNPPPNLNPFAGPQTGPVLLNYHFDYQLSVNFGEIVTLFSETTPSAPFPTFFDNRAMIDFTPSPCDEPTYINYAPNSVVPSAGSSLANFGGISSITVSSISSGQIPVPFQIYDNFTLNGTVLNTPNQTTLGTQELTNNSIFAQVFNNDAGACKSFQCNTITGLNASGAFNLNYGNCAGNASIAVILNSGLQDNTSIGMNLYTQYGAGAGEIQGCSIVGPSVPQCIPPPTTLNQTLTFQMKSGPICFLVSSTNNSYFQLTDTSGKAIDLTSRLTQVSISQNGLP